jgi:hypothetical protein
MRELLADIRSLLREGLPYIRSGDIFISIDTEFFPNDVKFPCIGIKDGTIEREAAISGMLRRVMFVDISLFVNLPKKVDAALVGDSTNKGILDMEEDVHALLDDHGFGRFDIVFCERSEPTQVLFVSDSDIKMQKTLTYKFEGECVPR